MNKFVSKLLRKIKIWFCELEIEKSYDILQKDLTPRQRRIVLYDLHLAEVKLKKARWAV